MTPREANADLLAEITALRERVASLARENAELQGALGQDSHREAATSEILRVISSSPTNVQPVFDAVAESAARLCESYDSQIWRRDGDRLFPVAHHGPIRVMPTDEFILPLRGTISGRSVLEGRTVQVCDVQAEVEEFPRGSEFARQLGYRTILSVPLMREGVAIGAIVLRRTETRLFTERQLIRVEGVVEEFARGEYPEARALQEGSGFRTVLVVPLMREGAVIGVINIRRLEVRAFTAKQIALVKTFADQAVIAINNVRLLRELQAKNLALTEAHAQGTAAPEQQTAEADVLRVISRSQTDVQPVFDTIVRSAVTLCDGLFSALFQFDGELIHHVAQHNFTPEALEQLHRTYPTRPSRALGSGRAILERAVAHIPDIEVDPEYQHQTLSRAIGHRSSLSVPMLREGAPIGVIWVARAEPGSFSDSEIELLKTFADQAVIAVENVRLFKELQARTGELTQSVEKLTALGEVGRAVSSTLDVETVLDTIVSRASQLAGAEGCSIYEYDEATEEFELRAAHNDDTEFVAALRASHLRKGEGLM